MVAGVLLVLVAAGCGGKSAPAGQTTGSQAAGNAGRFPYPQQVVNKFLQQCQSASAGNTKSGCRCTLDRLKDDTTAAQLRDATRIVGHEAMSRGANGRRLRAAARTCDVDFG